MAQRPRKIFVGRDASAGAGHIFVSYSHADLLFVQKIERRLADLGISLWIDYSAVDGGDRIQSVIERSISNSLAYVICLSDSSIASKWVDTELSIARTIAENRNGRFIIPILLDDCVVPATLSTFNYIDFRQTEDFPTAVDRLADSLRFYEDDDSTSSDEVDDAFLERFTQQLLTLRGKNQANENDINSFLFDSMVRLVVDCVRYERYEGSYIDNITDILVNFSHGTLTDASELTETQSLAFSIAVLFASRFQKKTRPPPSYAQALASLITNNYVGNGFRKLFMDSLMKLNQMSSHSILTAIVIPNIFHPIRLSSFAVLLISELRLHTNVTIHDLWDTATYANRLIITRYIYKYFRWSENSSNCEIVDIRNRSGLAFAPFKENSFYLSLLSDEHDDHIVTDAANIIATQLSISTPSVNAFVGAFEILAQSAYGNRAVAHIVEQFLLSAIKNSLPWSKDFSVSIALELCTSRFVGVGETHALILFLNDYDKETRLMSMSQNWKHFWLAPKYHEMSPSEHSFVFDWYLFCKDAGGHVPHLIHTLDQHVDSNARNNLCGYLRKINRKHRDPIDKIALRYASGSLPGLDACFEIVALTDTSGSDWKADFKEFKKARARKPRRKK